MTTKEASETATTNGRLSETTSEEGRKIFDRAAKFYLGISGREFIRRWDAGEYENDLDRPGVLNVATLLPFVR